MGSRPPPTYGVVRVGSPQASVMTPVHACYFLTTTANMNYMTMLPRGACGRGISDGSQTRGDSPRGNLSILISGSEVEEGFGSRDPSDQKVGLCNRPISSHLDASYHPLYFCRKMVTELLYRGDA